MSSKLASSLEPSPTGPAPTYPLTAHAGGQDRALIAPVEVSLSSRPEACLRAGRSVSFLWSPHWSRWIVGRWRGVTNPNSVSQSAHPNHLHGPVACWSWLRGPCPGIPEISSMEDAWYGLYFKGPGWGPGICILTASPNNSVLSLVENY